MFDQFAECRLRRFTTDALFVGDGKSYEGGSARLECAGWWRVGMQWLGDDNAADVRRDPLGDRTRVRLLA